MTTIIRQIFPAAVVNEPTGIMMKEGAKRLNRDVAFAADCYRAMERARCDEINARKGLIDKVIVKQSSLNSFDIDVCDDGSNGIALKNTEVKNTDRVFIEYQNLDGVISALNEINEQRKRARKQKELEKTQEIMEDLD